MNKTELLQALEATVPPLKGKLHIERVLYKKEANKAYVSFLCDELVGERDYLLLENRLRQLFPQLTVAMRIASPGLGEAFLQDVNAYKSVLTDFLRRLSPAMAAWVDDTGWTYEDGSLLLTCPDAIALRFFKNHQVDEKLKTAIYDIFRVNVPVSMNVCGEREAWTQKMRAERGFSFPTKEETSEPPLWDDSVLAQQAGEMDSGFGGGFTSTVGGANGAGSSGSASGNTASSSNPNAASRIAASGAARPAAKNEPKGNVIKGRGIADPPVPICELAEDSGVVVIEGIVTGLNDPKELKGGETVLSTFAVYDDNGTIYCKAFYQYRARRTPMGETPKPPTDEERQKVNEQLKMIKNGMCVRVRGECRQDNFLGELSITVRDIQEMPKKTRQDTAEEKRIELHMHTTMSTMDATGDAGALIAQAAKWGHPAVAITDHGSAQAFPAAFGAAKKNGIKLIPGVEGYLCEMNPIVRDADDHPLDSPIVVLDFETTGLSHAMDRIIEVGAVKLVDGQVVDELSILCDPGVPLKPKISEITGITDLMLRGKETPAEGVRQLLDFIGDCPVAAHNAPFDMGMLHAECRRMGVSFHAPVIDTLTFSRRLYTSQKSHKLGAICRLLGVSLKNAHRAVHDAAATA
ncbi:MAG: PHP domain-containing protein, partial [Clostridiales bacterium]|nr:PHP domain-containing protein [Clostridiales bacterium]